MKALLGVLLCLVLATSQTFAHKGGPTFGNHVTTTGIYAGLFFPTDNTDNSLGIFSAIIPKTGLGTGTVALFREGIAYPGTITAIADPDSAKLTAIANASISITFTSEKDMQGNTTSTVVTYNANGRIDGTIKANTNLNSTAIARITGTANITYARVGSIGGIASAPAGNSNGPIPYTVSGFKQAETTQ